MAARARYYDGVTANALDVAVRPSTLELVISSADMPRWISKRMFYTPTGLSRALYGNSSIPEI